MDQNKNTEILQKLKVSANNLLDSAFHGGASEILKSAIIFDCESTGLVDARIIEAGLIEVDVQDGVLIFGKPELSRYNPENPSDLSALNIHHILDSELEGMPSYTTFKLPDHVEYVIGQNIDYDMQVIGNPQQYKRICTVGMARKLWPEADSHSLGCMMYHLFGRTDATRQMLKDAHSAMADCRMTYLLLEEILKKTNIQNLEQLHIYSEECKISTAMLNEPVFPLPSSKIKASATIDGIYSPGQMIEHRRDYVKFLFNHFIDEWEEQMWNLDSNFYSTEFRNGMHKIIVDARNKLERIK